MAEGEGRKVEGTSVAGTGTHATALNASNVPETPGEMLSCMGLTGYLGLVLTLILAMNLIAIMIRRTLRRCQMFLCFASILPLLALVGMVMGLTVTFHEIATVPYLGVMDMAAGIYVSFFTQVWMLMLSVVTVPLGLYLTISELAKVRAANPAAGAGTQKERE